MGEALGMIGAQALGGVMGMALADSQDNRQYRQAERMQQLQIQGSKKLTDYNAAKQLQMWKDTSYGAQKEQMKLAGINPALMYGMGGGGGQSNSVNAGSVSGGAGPSTGGEVQGMMGMGLQAGAQLALIKAQKENIEADTANKKAETGYTSGAKTEETQAGATQKKSQTTGQDLDNLLKEYLTHADETGANVEGDLKKGVLGQTAIQELKNRQIQAIFTTDENARQKAMNSAKISEITQEIDLMKKKGMTEVQILQNLKKDGTLKAAEIEWNKIGLTKETLGQLLIGLLKTGFK